MNFKYLPLDFHFLGQLGYEIVQYLLKKKTERQFNLHEKYEYFFSPNNCELFFI